MEKKNHMGSVVINANVSLYTFILSTDITNKKGFHFGVHQYSVTNVVDYWKVLE